MGRKKSLKKSFPAVTSSLLSVAFFVWLWPGMNELLVYDRYRILAGEGWRIFTGPFAHFSDSHLFWNALVSGAAGFAIESAGYRHFWLTSLLSLVFPGIGYIFLAPEILRFGGLSGQATAAVAFLCLWKTAKPCAGRRLWILILVLTCCKIIIEAILGEPVFAKAGNADFRVLPSAHLIGLGAAVSVYLFSVCNKLFGYNVRKPPFGWGTHETGKKQASE